MKNIFIALTAAAAIIFSAQTQAQAQHKWGIRAGVNVSNQSFKIGLERGEGYAMVGPQMGIAYETSIGSGFFFETGLYGSMKGMRIPAQYYDLINEYKEKIFYLQLPLLVGYNVVVNPTLTLKPFFGVYGAYGVSGKAYAGSQQFNLFNENTPQGPGTQNTNHRDGGLRMGVAAELAEHFYLGAGYEHGLLNITHDKETPKTYNNAFTFNVGYGF